MFNNKYNCKNEDNNSSKNDSTINFKMKKANTRCKLGKGLVIFLVLLILLILTVSNVSLIRKYNKIMEQRNKINLKVGSEVFEYDKITHQISESIVAISNEESKLTKNSYFEPNLTGVILSEEGTILTNYSKIKDFRDIYVKLPSSGSMPIKASLVGISEDVDVAIIKIYYKGKLSPIKIANEDEVIEGQEIAVLSNSIGNEYIERVIPGIITSTHQTIKDKSDREHRLLEISSLINENNTGGAICNSKGELIGLASVDITNKKNKQGLYYAIDLRELQKISQVTDVFKSKLGISGGLIEDPKSRLKGFYVENVKESGVAYNAGIRATDIIIQLDGVDILTVNDLSNIMINKKAGEKVLCKIVNNGNIKELELLIQ
ncbi:S1C family serine protease [Clostridium septicum]|uniref:Serine protease n=1 Tax=Clostridium septicum TaxID=1504 RepID=A0A9N7JKR6_CLOSE|nr:trypsin-like peptidase domain-containing protein [Clostridium septicum]AYE34468.1 serine protease [Clostridium septicum]MDU1312452.1 trypsin-like peptidase domain-containing protein [Clostridium septicum]QAS59871.1 PDZ domain-containing protein [Clostridium septicum]UEC20889.1 S1C family serine protease [Clostridium septicum]USS01061.1 S1C family serine protease [Clostridium septicum]